MATYLLLRNNKELGPLSLQHLIQLGLKPYDLVWVQGKSAAWRYPSEIEELKPYAAAVEEQPFDRFYKKAGEKKEEKKEISEVVFPAETARTQETVRQMQPEKMEASEIVFPVEAANTQETVRQIQPEKKEASEIIFPVEAAKIQETKIQETITQIQPGRKNNWEDIEFPDEVEKQPEEIKHEKYYPRKTVYVTMPVQQMPAPKQEPVFNIHSFPATNTHEEPVGIETKYSQPLDEIKEMYVKKLQDRKQQSAHKKFITQSLKKAAMIIGIISVGVLIGFAIKPKTAGQIASVNTEPLIKTEITNDVTDEQAKETSQEELPATNTNETIERKAPDKKVNDEPVEDQKPLVEKQEAIADKKNTMQPKQKITEEKDQPISYESSPAVEIDPVTGERIKQTRGNNIFRETKENNAAPQKNLNKFVSVTSNDYHIVAFGGIRNLQLTVNNDSKYALDNVLVELQYVKPNELPLKTETVYFKSVSPNGSLTIRVPDTNRGIKVKYRIIKVESKEFNNDMAGL